MNVSKDNDSEREGDSGEMLSANMVDSTRQAREEEERGTEMKTQNYHFLWIFWRKDNLMDRIQ